MSTGTGTYGVRVVRGPFVQIAPHPNSVDSLEGVLEWAAARERQRPLAADLFCGAGGLSLGIAAAGYDVVLGVDSDPLALETYAGLHPGLTLCRDLSDPVAVNDVAGMISQLGVELIAGGPPCQPFSKAGASKIRSLVRAGIRPAYDDRRDLWRAFLDIVLQVQPPAVLLENVPDMAIASDSTIVRAIVGELEDHGYAVHTALLHAREHGVPQFRQRFFLTALAGGVRFISPTPTRSPLTVRDAIGDLPAVDGGWRPPGGAEGFLEYEPPPEPSVFIRRARRGLQGADRRRIYDHIARPVREDDRVIFESMNSSTRYSDLDESLKRYRDDIFDDKYKRLSWTEPSRSITAHIARDGYWYIHPEQVRTLTVREAARLQTFPDRVRFAGPPSAAFRQIGNAVPPLLAERVVRSIWDSLRSAEPVGVSSAVLSRRLATWFEAKDRLAMPWLAAATTWSALQGQVLLERARAQLVQTAWGTLEKLDSPDRTIESADQLRDVAELIGRPARGQHVLDLARWFLQNREALTTTTGLRKTPTVSRRVAEIATLIDPKAGPTPVVLNQGNLRVASRVFGLPLRQRRSSDGRLAVTRLLGWPTDARPDDTRMAMAGVIELAATLCTPRDPTCGSCPLGAVCDWASRSESA